MAHTGGSGKDLSGGGRYAVSPLFGPGDAQPVVGAVPASARDRSHRGGPATQDLNRRGIWYPDLSWILTAYQRELSKRDLPSTGAPNPNPPPSPWKDLEQVRLRGAALREEMEAGALAASETREGA